MDLSSRKNSDPQDTDWSTSMTTHNRILIDAQVCHGKPVIRGTRVPVAIVVGSLAGGMSFEEIEAEYAVTREDIQAALAYSTLDADHCDSW
jgi:uncharacterized protein (DUF433 family)